MASRPTVRVKVQPRSRIKVGTTPKFPAQVIAGAGITIEQSGGVFTFSVAADSLPETLGLEIGSDVQAYDADLTAVAALNTVGFAARIASETWALRTLTGTAAEITVTTGDGVSGNPTLSLPSALTFTGKTITGGTFVQFVASEAMGLFSATAGAAAGPGFNIIRGNSAGAANDLIGYTAYFGRDAGGNFAEYARAQARILDATDTSEDGQFSIQTMVAGTLADRATFYSGLQLGAPIGGDKGAGTLNAAGTIYVNNAAVGTASNNLSFFAATTSAQLAGVISDETGSGALVFAASPTFTGTITAAAANFSGTITFGTGTVTALTNDATPDAAADYLLTYDASATAFKKSLISAVVGAAAAGVTSLNGQTGALDAPSICGLRLTLVTGTPVINSDQSSIDRVIATPAFWAGNYVPLWDGTDLVPTFFGEVFQLLNDTTKSPAAAVSNAIYDIYAWNDGGTKRISRSDYWKKSATITMTIATPCVVTWAAHGLASGTPIKFTTTGALPSITSTTFANTLYVSSPTTNTFKLVAAAANADNPGAELETTGSQSGTHTGTAGDDFGTVARGSGGNCEVDYSTSGLALNKNAITNGPSALRGTLLGSIRTDVSGAVTYKLGGAASGGDPALLTVANVYNTVEVEAKVSDTTASWTQTSATVGTFNPATGSGLGNRVSVLSCLTRNTIDVALLGRVFVSAAGVAVAGIGIGKNSLTAYDVQAQVAGVASSGTSSTVAPREVYRNLLGWNWFQALQSSDGTNANTFVGTAVQQRMIARAWL